jgi:hypothetical protein
MDRCFRAGTLLAVASALLAAGCDPHDAPLPEPPRWVDQASTTHVPDSFVDRVWVVAESEQVEAGELRVFLSEGTLVMASPYATPSFGTWRYRDGRLTITEEGRQYEVDVLESTESDFRIRIHSPGEPVEIHFKRASQADQSRTR